MQILEAEIALREETRVAEQARAAMKLDDFQERADGLADQQGQLETRCEDLAERIRALKDGEELFAKEINLLAEVATVMDDAESILATPETGAEAIAAETEAIELLLASKRINPNGGGGGGSTPGGGGGGTTTDAAIALVGKGVNPREVRKARIVSQNTGKAAVQLPEEFRAGLDEYFNRILKADR